MLPDMDLLRLDGPLPTDLHDPVLVFLVVGEVFLQ